MNKIQVWYHRIWDRLGISGELELMVETHVNTGWGQATGFQFLDSDWIYICEF